MDHMQLTDYLDTAVEAALAAGRLQRFRFASSFAVDLKGAKDLVTELDIASETLIVKMLLDRFPGHGILAEEAAYPPAMAYTPGLLTRLTAPPISPTAIHGSAPPSRWNKTESLW